VIGEHTAVLKGLDGRKMSKSYNNTIPLFADEKRLRKLVMKIKTNSLEPGEPKDTADSTLFDIYKAFATEEETRDIEERFAGGIGWGEMKQLLFEYINEQLKPAREEYERLIANPGVVEAELRRGAEKARGWVSGHALPSGCGRSPLPSCTVRRLRRCRTVPDFCG
jgi:tryptophanyl-tRNA synthetase